MLDVTQLTDTDLGKLESINALGLSRRRKPTNMLTPREQRKLRRFLMKECEKQISELTPEVQEYLKNCSDSYFFDFLTECFAERIRRYTAEEDRELERFAVFGEKVHFAARELSHGHPFSTIEYRDGEVSLCIDEGAFFICLTLRGVTEFCEDFKLENAYWAKLDYDKEKEEYFFEAEMERDGDLKFTFTDADAEFVPYNPLFKFSVEDEPWRYLSRVCAVILIKAETAPELLNDKEKELLTLMKELNNVTFVTDGSMFPLLRALTRKYDLPKTDKILRDIESGKDHLRNLDGTRKLLGEFHRISNVKMWREVYDMLADSQKEYKTPAELTSDPSEVIALRDRVTKVLLSRGYLGTYPCFAKEGRMRGIHTFESHGQLYTVAFEKRMQSRIRFSETSGGFPQLTIDSGIAFLKKDESDDDFFSYAFNARGRRCFAGRRFTDFKSTNEDLEKVVTIAAKKAEFEKLTKEEKALHSTNFPWGLLIFIILFSIIVGGGLFFIGMTLLSFLAWLSTSAAGWTTVTLSEFAATFPWLEYAGMSFLGFGGIFGLIFGILTCLAKRK